MEHPYWTVTQVRNKLLERLSHLIFLLVTKASDILKQLFSNFGVHQNPLKACYSTLLVPIFGISDSVELGPRNISNELPGDVDAAQPGTIL